MEERKIRCTGSYGTIYQDEIDIVVDMEKYLSDYGFSKVTVQYISMEIRDYVDEYKVGMYRFLQGMKESGVSLSDTLMIFMLKYFIPYKNK